MNIYKREDIQDQYTEMVDRYIRKGYVINPESMSGSQGEIAKIDLTDGREIVRVYIEHKTHYGSMEDDWFDYDSIDIVAESFPYQEQTGLFSDIWTGKGEEIKRIEFCKLRGEYNCNLGGSFTTKEAYVQMIKDTREKRAERRAHSQEDTITSNALYEKMLEIARKQRGCKTIKKEDISFARRINGSYVLYLKNRRQRAVEITANGIRVW